MHSGELIHLAYAVAADYSGADSSSQLYIMRDSLSSFMMMGMAIPHDAPYKQQLDKAIHNIASVKKCPFILMKKIATDCFRRDSDSSDRDTDHLLESWWK